MIIRPMIDADADAVLAIYAEGIAGGDATFETETKPWAEWITPKLRWGCFVAEIEGEVAGWIIAAPTSPRPCYAGVVEESVYVARRFAGRGVASALLKRLIEASEAEGVWTLIAVLFPENTVSRRLHEAHGFRVVGRRERIGFSHLGPNRGWRDTLLMERRSAVV